MRVIICYDISDDKLRYKLVKYLKEFAYRVQYSVFETELTLKQISRIRAKIDGLLSKKEKASVLFLSLNENSGDKYFRIGKNLEDCDEKMVIV